MADRIIIDNMNPNSNTKKTVSTIAVPLSGNRGSSSMLMSIVENLSAAFDNIHFNVYSYYPKVDKKKNKWQNVTILSGTPLCLLLKIVPLSFIYYLFSLIKMKIPQRFLGKEIRALLQSDLYVAAGGTTFNDAKLLKVVFNVLCLLPGFFLGRKVVLYTQTLGPFKNPLNRMAAKWILPKARVVIARGKESYNNLKCLGLENIDWAMDAAFALGESSCCETVADKYRKLFNGKVTVGISPNSIVASACEKKGIKHTQIFAQFIDFLIENNYQPVLIPHSAKLNSKNRHNNDIPVIDEIIKQVRSPERLMYIKDDYSYLELRSIIGMMDYYVASRFHSMISALYMKVPLIVYGWGYHKYREVISEFGLGDETVLNYADLSAESMRRAFGSVVKNRDVIRDKILRGLPSVISKANRANEILAEQLSL